MDVYRVNGSVRVEGFNAASSADELIYHLPVPQQFAQAGHVFPSYDNSLGNMPFLIHMIYVVCIMIGSDIAAKLFSLFLAVSTAVSLYAFCNRYISRQVGVISLFAFFASGMIVELAVTTRIDVSLAGLLFASTYAMINYLSTHVRGWLWLSALFAGLVSASNTPPGYGYSSSAFSTSYKRSEIISHSASSSSRRRLYIPRFSCSLALVYQEHRLV